MFMLPGSEVLFVTCTCHYIFLFLTSNVLYLATNCMQELNPVKPRHSRLLRSAVQRETVRIN